MVRVEVLELGLIDSTVVDWYKNESEVGENRLWHSEELPRPHHSSFNK